MICWAVQRAPGCSVTLKWTTRRRSWTMTKKTKSTRKVAVSTVKKSMDASEPRWLSRKVRQVWEGWLRGFLGMKRETLLSLMTCFAFSHRFGNTSVRPRNSVQNRRIFSAPAREAGAALAIGRQSCGGSLLEDLAARSVTRRAIACARACSRAATSASAASISIVRLFSWDAVRASWHQPVCAGRPLLEAA